MSFHSQLYSGHIPTRRSLSSFEGYMCEFAVHACSTKVLLGKLYYWLVKERRRNQIVHFLSLSELLCLTIMHAFETFLRLSGALREEEAAAAAAPTVAAPLSTTSRLFKEEKQR